MAEGHSGRARPRGVGRGLLTKGSAPRSLLEGLLSHRILFVAGKGGTGKTAITAALAMLAARAGKRVLAIEADAKGDLSRALGSDPVGFKPVVVQKNISVLALHPEESLREYLRIFFKVPGVTRLTPLSRIFDFIASAVPGPHEMLIVGKIAYEERARDRDGDPVWDIVIVDGQASGHIVSQLRAPDEMMKLARGGIIRGQLEWVSEVLADHTRTNLVLTTLPEEMPVVETIELAAQVRRQTQVAIGACFLNRTAPVRLTRAHRDLLEAMADPSREARVSERLGGSVTRLREGVLLADRMQVAQTAHERHLRGEMDTPVVDVPVIVAREGLATTRALAAAIAELQG